MLVKRSLSSRISTLVVCHDNSSPTVSRRKFSMRSLTKIYAALFSKGLGPALRYLWCPLFGPSRVARRRECTVARLVQRSLWYSFFGPSRVATRRECTTARLVQRYLWYPLFGPSHVATRCACTAACLLQRYLWYPFIGPSYVATRRERTAARPAQRCLWRPVFGPSSVATTRESTAASRLPSGAEHAGWESLRRMLRLCFAPVSFQHILGRRMGPPQQNECMMCGDACRGKGGIHNADSKARVGGSGGSARQARAVA